VMLVSKWRTLPRAVASELVLKRWISLPATYVTPHTHTNSKLSIEQMRSKVQAKRGFILDMDGVIYHGNDMLPGVADFFAFLQKSNKKFIFLTNSSERTPGQLSEKIKRLSGFDFPSKLFHTCALSTAHFVTSQHPGARVFVVGEEGLVQAIQSEGHTIADTNVDFVVVGETRSYNYDVITTAAELVRRGAKLIGTNRDVRDRMHAGFVPSTGALITPIELTCDRKAYFVGKPNPIIMTHALRKFEGLNRNDVVIIGDNMDTDIIGGIEADIETVLVFSGVTAKSDLHKFPFRPSYVFEGIGDIA